jgi:hypothetical protein
MNKRPEDSSQGPCRRLRDPRLAERKEALLPAGLGISDAFVPNRTCLRPGHRPESRAGVPQLDFARGNRRRIGPKIKPTEAE